MCEMRKCEVSRPIIMRNGLIYGCRWIVGGLLPKKEPLAARASFDAM